MCQCLYFTSVKRTVFSNIPGSGRTLLEYCLGTSSKGAGRFSDFGWCPDMLSKLTFQYDQISQINVKTRLKPTLGQIMRVKKQQWHVAAISMLAYLDESSTSSVPGRAELPPPPPSAATTTPSTTRDGPFRAMFTSQLWTAQIVRAKF